MTFVVFLKKEMLETLKTSRLLIVGALFIFFALLSPVSAKYTNEIIKMAGGLGDFQLPEPVYLDSFIQYFKNTNLFGMLSLIFAYMGTLSKEKEQKTVYLMLTKKLSRKTMYLAKFISSTVIYTLVYIVSILFFYIYTILLFGNFSNDHVLTAFLVYWIYGLFILSFTIFFSNITTNISMVATLSICTYFLFNLLAQIKMIKKFVPATIASLPIDIIKGTLFANDYILTIISTLIFIVLLTIGGICLFEEQEL